MSGYFKRMVNSIQSYAGNEGTDGVRSAYKQSWRESKAKKARRKTARASRKRNRG